jgi:capsular polysaccharide biosynthesis protein
MAPTALYRAPHHWLHIGKYPAPIGGAPSGWRRSSAPGECVPLAELARQRPDRVRVHACGEAERLAEFAYQCFIAGDRHTRTLPAAIIEPPYVAELRQGRSFGRHGCVIGPDGQAVRETGFNLDGSVLISKAPISRWRLRYWRKRWEGDVTTRPWLPAPQRVEGRVAVLNAPCCHNYYHWLIDILPRLEALRTARCVADYYLVDCLSPFQRSVLDSLGIAPAQLIQPHCRLLLEADVLLAPSPPSPTCLQRFGSRLLEALGVTANGAERRRIFISRAKARRRTLVNESTVRTMLQAKGFEIHSMEDYPLAKQARLVHEAEIVVATHGAGLANLLFARPGTQVVEIVPEGRFNATCYPKKSRILSLDHQLVFAERRPRHALLAPLDDLASALQYAQEAQRRATAA